MGPLYIPKSVFIYILSIVMTGGVQLTDAALELTVWVDICTNVLTGNSDKVLYGYICAIIKIVARRGK
jgi:hypothetical protein